MNKSENIAEAVGYGIKALGMSPSEFFKCMEEVRVNFKENNYSHWLSSKIIDYIESQGLSYNEIFTKQNRILYQLANSSKEEYKEVFLKHLKGLFADKRVISFSEGLKIGEICSFNNDCEVDISDGVTPFIDSLDQKVQEILKYNEEAVFVFEVGNEAINKSHKLFKNAKQFNITLKDEFDALLYRLVTMSSVVDLSNIRFVFISKEGVFAEYEKEGIYELFMGYFTCHDALLFNPLDVSHSLVNEGYIMMTEWCSEPAISINEKAVFGTEDSECIASVISLTDEGFEEEGKLRFTFSGEPFNKEYSVEGLQGPVWASIEYTAKELLKSSNGFAVELKNPISVTRDFNTLKVLSTTYGFYSGAIQANIDFINKFIDENYGYLNIEAISLMEFYNKAREKLLQINPDSSERNANTIMISFNRPEVVKEFESRVSKLGESIKNSGVLECFLI